MAGEAFRRALELSALLHEGQRRKAGPEVPYVAHPLAVASIVLEYGGGEEAAIVALLHDAAEDCGGGPVLDRLRRDFGAAVAEAVAALSDSLETPKPPWRPRKEAYLARLRGASETVRMVAAADAVANLQSLLRAFRLEGEAIWAHFKGGRDGLLWYYRSIAEAIGDLPPRPELLAALVEFESIFSARVTKNYKT